MGELKRLFKKEQPAAHKVMPHFTEQLKGLDVRRIGLSTGGIDAVTGATISSSAVVESVREYGIKLLGAETGK